MSNLTEYMCNNFLEDLFRACKGMRAFENLRYKCTFLILKMMCFPQVGLVNVWIWNQKYQERIGNYVSKYNGVLVVTFLNSA